MENRRSAGDRADHALSHTQPSRQSMPRLRQDLSRERHLRASSLLSADLLKSNLYTVDEEVINDGLLNHYTVRSIFGVFRPNSTLAVKQLLHEIRAIAAMKKVETKSTAKESVVQSGKNTVDAVANLVTDPKETLEGAAAGVSSLFNRASQAVGKRQTTACRRQSKLNNSSANPNQKAR